MNGSVNRVPTQTSYGPAPVELVEGELYLLGCNIELDGRISWVPADTRGWQSLNCYVLINQGNVLVVDPGPQIVGPLIVEQLRHIVPAAAHVSIFVTRAELDTTGAIGAIARAFPVDRLYAGGGPNPFDSFDAAGVVQFADRRERIQLERMPAGFKMVVGAGRELEVIRPTIRLLATWWGYDAMTRTLFTSDTFTHTVSQSFDSARVLTQSLPAQSDAVQVKAHLTAKFEWLRHAKTPTLLNGLKELFAELEIDRIAPAHGLVLEGPNVVQEHLDAVFGVLQELSS